MLPRAERLTTAQFDRAFAHSQSVRHPLVTLRAHRRGDGESFTRAAFVVPKKVAKLSSERNHIRRRLRERYRLLPGRDSGVLAGCDLIFMATPQTREATAVELDSAIAEVLRRISRKIGGDGGPRNSVESAPVAATQSVEKAPDIASDAPQNVAKPPLPLTSLALGLIRFYQRFISPGLPPSCRFEPSCSRYTYASIERFGLVRGGFLGLCRLCKCNPWHEGGLDPVPQQFPLDLHFKAPDKSKS